MLARLAHGRSWNHRAALKDVQYAKLLNRLTDRIALKGANALGYDLHFTGYQVTAFAFNMGNNNACSLFANNGIALPIAVTGF